MEDTQLEALTREVEDDERLKFMVLATYHLSQSVVDTLVSLLAERIPDYRGTREIARPRLLELGLIEQTDPPKGYRLTKTGTDVMDLLLLHSGGDATLRHLTSTISPQLTNETNK